MHDQMSRSEVFAELRSRGVVKAVVEFSGGNDEGGADDVRLLRPDGTEVDLPARTYGIRIAEGQWVHEHYVDGKWDRRPATSDEVTADRFSGGLEAPVYDEFGSFAGEFSVSGTVTWDVDAGKVTMTKSESSSQSYEYEAFEA